MAQETGTAGRKKLQAFGWFGGKGHMLAKLLPLLPACRTYVEPFGGAGTVLLNRDPSPVEVFNDVDGGVVGFFRVVADAEQFARFHRRVALLPYSRELFNEYRATWREQADPVERAARWFVVARQSFSGRFGAGWSSVVTASGGGMVATARTWISGIERLPEIHARLQRVQIEQADWRVILARYDTPETLFYLDPPYVHGTRSSKRYAHDMTDDDHRELVAAMLALQGKVVLSGYAHEIYAPLAAAGWQRGDFPTACHAAAKTRATGILGSGASTRMQPRIETVWRNPAALDNKGNILWQAQ